MRIHNTDGWKQRSKSRSMFRRILKPLCLLATLDAFLLVMVLQAAGVLRQLNQNSFDLFKNFEERGNIFKSIVEDLKNNWRFL